MTFKEAVRHLEEAGLSVMMPNGKTHRPKASQAKRQRGKVRLRNPRRSVKVLVVKRDDMPEELREMIRQSRAEIRDSLRTRKKH